MGASLSKALAAAVARGDVDAVASLAAKQPSGAVDAVRLGERGLTLVHVAAEHGQAAMLAALVRLGAALDTPDKYGRTPMHVAAEHGHASVVETLARLGSTALDTPDYGKSPDPHLIVGIRTPIELAFGFGHVAVVEAMIRLGTAALNDPVAAACLLRSAHERKHNAVVELLLAAGVDPAALHRPQTVPAERLLELRRRLYFSKTLLDVLLAGQQ